MPANKIKQPVIGKRGRATVYLMTHAACGTKFWRTRAQLAYPEKCGVCGTGEIAVLEQVMQ